MKNHASDNTSQPVVDSDVDLSCIELNGQTIISIKPNVPCMKVLCFTLLFTGLFLTFGIYTRALWPIQSLLGLMMLGVWSTAYNKLFSRNVFVITQDVLEIRWTCKPFSWHKQIAKKDIHSIDVQIRYAENDSDNILLTLIRANGRTTTLLSGKNYKRFARIKSVLERELFRNRRQNAVPSATMTDATEMQSGKHDEA